MNYISFIGFNFLISLFIAFICISYDTFPIKYSITNIVNPYINNSGIFSIKDIKHNEYLLIERN